MTRRRCAFAASLLLWAGAFAQPLPTPSPAPPEPGLTLEALPRPATPPPERGTVVPAQVERWRQEAQAFEFGEGVERDAVKAAQSYCRAARYGDAQAQYSLAWMLTNARGIERDEAQAAHLFAAAAEQGLTQAVAMAQRLGTPRGDPPPCLRPPDEDPPLLAQDKPAPPRVLLPPGGGRPAPFPGGLLLPPPPPPAGAPPQIVRFVELVAPQYQLQPHVVLALIKQESNFDPLAVSPKNAQGLMQLIPDTARRFNVRNVMDPAQNLRGGMAYLRWLLATFEGDLTLALAAYNAGEGAVERYRGVPPYAETRLYVRRIIAAINGQRSHPFDPQVAPPSELITLLKARLRALN
ncbi:MAG: transglycosylase SLT domain-containing protein [Rubrivivax sp.]|nr:transglycosylase SLT domain-containing protein [Rubrivivax sp.]